MLRTLLESNAPRQRRRASMVASIVVHTAIIGSAIVATASARTESLGADPEADIRPVYITRVPDEGRRVPNVASPSQPPRRQASIEGLVRVDHRPIVFSPTLGPTTPIDLDPGRLLARDSVGFGPPRGPIGGALIGRVVGDEPATAATVEKVAAMLAPPRPRYPDQLRAAGVSGRVVVRLVVDTMGRVEPTSVVIRESSHDLFVQAVRAVLPALRFAPAQAGGRKVRMLVDRPFEFRLNE